MRLKLTVASRGPDRDVLVTADAAATVGDVAEHVSQALDVGMSKRGGGLTLRAMEAGGLPEAPRHLLDPRVPIVEAAIRSGLRVEVAPAGDVVGARTSEGAEARAKLTVVEGPDAGREFSLAEGFTMVGREDGCDVPLSDRFVSKRHLRISVADVIEVIDQNSANGTQVGGEHVQRAVVGSNDVVHIGDTGFRLSPVGRPKAVALATNVAFNRPPVVQQPFAGGEIEAPEPPGPVKPNRFPVIALISPVVVALVMFLLVKFGPGNQQISPMMFIFMGLSPLLMIGAFFDQRRQAKSEKKVAEREFGEAVDGLRADLAARAEREVSSRLTEHPSTTALLAAVQDHANLLWMRRTDRPAFLDVRLGIGTMPSRTVVKMPNSKRTTKENWARLAAVEAEFAVVHDVPVVASLSEAGGLGVAGRTDLMTSVARALVAQLVSLHSPADLTLAAVGSAQSAASWDWLKWLPHVGSTSPAIPVPLADSAATAGKLLAQLEEIAVARAEESSSGGPAPMPAVVLLVMDDAPVERSRLVQLAESGPAVGIHIIWCALSVASIPAACRSFVELDSEGNGASGQVHLDQWVMPLRCESMGLEVTSSFARSLAPVVDSGARAVDDSDLPRSVSFLASLGTELGQSPDAIIERWVANDPALTGGSARAQAFSLRAVVGQGAGDSFALDLRMHGPHALVGGTSGAGKSEFLQSWVLSLAASQSPQRVTFLFVDYKGGSAFARCTELPHCVGLVTDLDQHLVRRALTSLRAELTYREHVLARYRAKDIIDLEKNPQAEQLPSLVIVVDEFAALAQEIPEFVDGVVDVAQRGRSLGLHLVLATQRPAGVIRGNLRANTNLRVSLRMADADDSTDVLGDGMAAGFDPAIPGRAAAKTGPGRITVFQSLYAGASTPNVAPRPSVDVETLSFGVPELLRADASGSVTSSAGEASDLNRTVDQIIGAARVLELPVPRKPWLPVLAPAYDLRLISQVTDAELVIGIQDEPHVQSNSVVHFRPDTDGNMAVIGTGGSGKSTVLRTLGIAAAGTRKGGPCDVYGLDFGARGLSMLSGLPHVGAVITGSDHERVGRLLRWLCDEMVDRASRYAAANAATIAEYRANANRPDERRILVLLDGFGAFRQDYELGTHSSNYSLLGQIAADGRAVGIHVVITADRPSAIPASFSATIQRRLTLRLSNPDDYAMVGVPSDVLNSDSPPGRGLLDDLEIQIAVIGGSASLPHQADVTAKLASALTGRGRGPARPIERLGERIALSELPPVSGGRIAIGVDGADLGPCSIEPVGIFLVAGPPGSGRSTAVAALLHAVRAASREAEFHLFADRRSALRNAADWTSSSFGDEEVVAAADELVSRFTSGLSGTSSRPVVVVFEGVDRFAGSLAEGKLEELAKLADGHEAFVIGEAETSGVGASYLLGPVFKAGRRGIALQPDDVDGQSLFKQPFGRITRSDYPTGRGLLVESGRVATVQIGLPE